MNSMNELVSIAKDHGGIIETKIAVCTDTGCACYSHKSHIRRYAALSLSKKSRALFCWIIRAGMLVFRAKNVRWIMRNVFRTSRTNGKILSVVK